MRHPRGLLLQEVDGRPVQLLPESLPLRQQLIGKVAVEHDFGRGEQPQDGDAGGDLVHEDHVGLEGGEEDEVEGGQAHSDVGAEGHEAVEKVTREPGTRNCHG